MQNNSVSLPLPFRSPSSDPAPPGAASVPSLHSCSTLPPAQFSPLIFQHSQSTAMGTRNSAWLKINPAPLPQACTASRAVWFRERCYPPVNFLNQLTPNPVNQPYTQSVLAGECSSPHSLEGTTSTLTPSHSCPSPVPPTPSQPIPHGSSRSDASKMQT